MVRPLVGGDPECWRFFFIFGFMVSICTGNGSRLPSFPRPFPHECAVCFPLQALQLPFGRRRIWKFGHAPKRSGGAEFILNKGGESIHQSAPTALVYINPINRCTHRQTLRNKRGVWLTSWTHGWIDSEMPLRSLWHNVLF